MTRLDCQFVYVFMSYKKGEGLILEIILVNLPASLHYNEFSNHGLEHCHFPNKGLDLQLLAEIYSPPNFSHLVPSPKSIHLNKYLKILPIAMKRESTVSLKKEVVKLRQESSSQANPFPLQVKPCQSLNNMKNAFTHLAGSALLWQDTGGVITWLFDQGGMSTPFLTLVSQWVVLSLPVAPSSHKSLQTFIIIRNTHIHLGQSPSHSTLMICLLQRTNLLLKLIL